LTDGVGATPKCAPPAAADGDNHGSADAPSDDGDAWNDDDDASDMVDDGERSGEMADGESAGGIGKIVCDEFDDDSTSDAGRRCSLARRRRAVGDGCDVPSPVSPPLPSPKVPRLLRAVSRTVPSALSCKLASALSSRAEASAPSSALLSDDPAPRALSCVALHALSCAVSRALSSRAVPRALRRAVSLPNARTEWPSVRRDARVGFGDSVVTDADAALVPGAPQAAALVPGPSAATAAAAVALGCG
jgi:hypothetical protein